MTLTLNSQTIIRNVAAAFEQTCHQADKAFSQALEISVYPWPNPTRRSNGDIVTSPRNIVDTGALKASQYFTKVDRQTCVIGYTADYAVAVHFGETLRNGTNRPARAWTKVAIGGSNPLLDFPLAFKQNYERIAA